MFRIIAKEDLASAVSKFIIHAPLVARNRKGGNFVIVRVIENGERIPLTIVDSNSAEGTITLIVQTIGKTAKLMCTKRAGDHLVAVLGSLGNPTPVDRLRRSHLHRKRSWSCKTLPDH